MPYATLRLLRRQEKPNTTISLMDSIALTLGIVLAVLILIYFVAGCGPALIAFSVAIVLGLAAGAVHAALTFPVAFFIFVGLVAACLGLAYWTVRREAASAAAIRAESRQGSAGRMTDDPAARESIHDPRSTMF